MKPALSLERILDIACTKSNPNLIPHIRRSIINSFDNLIDKGKEIEVNVEIDKNYEDLLSLIQSVVKNASRPKKSQQKSGKTVQIKQMVLIQMIMKQFL